MNKHRILITGMSGLIGGIARRQLEGCYELRALNRRQLPDVDCHCADIGDLDAILPAFEDVDTVIHLAAFVAMDAPWEAVPDLPQGLQGILPRSQVRHHDQILDCYQGCP